MQTSLLKPSLSSKGSCLVFERRWTWHRSAQLLTFTNLHLLCMYYSSKHAIMSEKGEGRENVQRGQREKQEYELKKQKMLRCGLCPKAWHRGFSKKLCVHFKAASHVYREKQSQNALQWAQWRKKKSTQDCGEDVVYVECSKPFTYEVPFKLSRSLRRQPKSDFMSSHLHMIE